MLLCVTVPRVNSQSNYLVSHYWLSLFNYVTLPICAVLLMTSMSSGLPRNCISRALSLGCPRVICGRKDKRALEAKRESPSSDNKKSDSSAEEAIAQTMDGVWVEKQSTFVLN